MSPIFNERTRLRRSLGLVVVIPVLMMSALATSFLVVEPGLSLTARVGIGLTIFLGAGLASITWRRIKRVAFIYERALRDAAASNRKTRAILESITDSFFALDRDWSFTYINGEGETLLGKSRGFLIGQTFWEEFPEPLGTRFRDLYQAAMERQENCAFEEYYQPWGKWVEVHAYPSSEGLSIYLKDITARRLAEEELKKYQQSLERRIEDRTTELRTANTELEAFSYSVSHDLRGPLRSIDGFSQALIEDYSSSLDDVGKDYLRRVRSATQRMGRLIDDLLNLARLGRSEMHQDLVDISRIAEEVAAELKRGEPQRSVTFKIEPDLTAVGDDGLLRVVLENLIGNAWKFTAQHKTAFIEFGARIENDRKVFYVKDDGTGFDMTYSNKLFGAFQRLHSAQTFRGTGIGLATVRRIINRHGGHVWAEGAVEKGATFYFDLAA